MQRFVAILVLILILGPACFLLGRATKSAPECQSNYQPVVKDDIQIRVRVLKSEKEIVFFHLLPERETPEIILDKVNDEAEKWQQQNPQAKVKDIRIEQKDYPRVYSVSLIFQTPSAPWLP